MTTRMKEQLEKVVRGEQGFAAFAKATREDWRALAKYILCRWSCPDAVEQADVEQELLLGAWRALRTFDAGRGALHGYVVFMAVTAAKRWCHEQRNAHRRRDTSTPRFPMALSRVDLQVEDVLVAPARQEEHVYRREVIERIMAGASRRERLCIQTLLERGSVEQAAQVLYADATLRRSLRWNSEADARRSMRQALNVMEA